MCGLRGGNQTLSTVTKIIYFQTVWGENLELKAERTRAPARRPEISFSSFPFQLIPNMSELSYNRQVLNTASFIGLILYCKEGRNLNLIFSYYCSYIPFQTKNKLLFLQTKTKRF